jgi:carboxyl-terminal processing protease
MRTTILIFCICAVLASGSCAKDTSRAHLFDEVWNTINDRFFDPTFGGHDWKEIGDRYRDLTIAADTDSVFYVRVNEMLFELGVSHIGVIPKAHPEWIGAPSLFSDGGIGAEARIVEGKMVVTFVRPESAAEKSGLENGFVVYTINGRTLEDLEAEALAAPRPPLDDRMLIAQKVVQQLYGPAGTTVVLEVIDGSGRMQEKAIERTLRPGRTLFAEGIPPTFIEFESRWVDDDIAYLRFNSFHPDLVDQILGAIDGKHNAAGLVIDLRGNPGGAFGVRRAIAERLVATRTLFWRYRRRSGVEEVYLNPAERVYSGPLAILTDCMSASSSEEFAGSMQAIGRAVVVGERTPGIVLTADIVELRSGDTLVYPNGQTVTPNGRVLEGQGVIPDIAQPLTISSLLRGADLQLDAAVRYIRDAAAE